MKYYFLWCMPDHANLRDIENDRFYPSLEVGAFELGEKISIEIPEPIHINLRPGEGDMPELFMTPLVIRKDLLDALEQFGINNIDSYETVIKDPATENQWNDYKLCNLIGVVDVFDIEASTLNPESPPDTAMLFDDIVINEQKGLGQHMFRPFNMTSHILVSEKVRNFLQETGTFSNLEFIEPEDYA